MQPNELNFDDDRSTQIKLPEQEKPLTLTISDSLNAYDEEITSGYKKRISEFLNSSNIWFKVCVDKLRKDLNAGSDYRLMEIFILSEQNSISMIFGMLFNVSGDKEHGRGFKINEKDFSIIEYGLSDVAYT